MQHSAAHPRVPRLLKAAADETLRQTSAIEAILLYGSRATGTHREDSDWDIAVVTELTRDEGFKAAAPLYTDEVAEQYWTEVACTTRGKIERYANTAGTLESRIAREAVLIAGEWKRPACTEGRELEIDARAGIDMGPGRGGQRDGRRSMAGDRERREVEGRQSGRGQGAAHGGAGDERDPRDVRGVRERHP